MPRFKDQAICIRDLDWSESSQVVVLLTETRGKIRGIAKGSRRPSPSGIARFSGGIDLLTAGEVVATTRPSSELASITEWDLQQNYFKLRRDLRAQRVAMYAADVCHALLADEDPHPTVYALLLGLLDGVCGVDSSLGVETELLRFQWGLLVDLGYKPELEADVHGGELLSDAEAYTFDANAGGFTRDNGVTEWRVRSATRRTLLRAEGEELEGTPEADAERANRLLGVYVRHLLGRELPTLAALRGTAP